MLWFSSDQRTWNINLYNEKDSIVQWILGITMTKYVKLNWGLRHNSPYQLLKSLELYKFYWNTLTQWNRKRLMSFFNHNMKHVLPGDSYLKLILRQFYKKNVLTWKVNVCVFWARALTVFKFFWFLLPWIRYLDLLCRVFRRRLWKRKWFSYIKKKGIFYIYSLMYIQTIEHNWCTIFSSIEKNDSQ